ncbi:MAG: hypothetical protein LBJ92_04645 [Holosporales bacterium]|jgi:hypothetical protein|nr:hypothetical protein [Holosporales bacterium]
MFNRAVFLEDTNKTHPIMSNIPDIRSKIDEFIDYDKSLFSKALDDICNNIVGNSMFTLLMMKLSPGKRLKIINIGPEEAGKQPVDQTGSSCFWHGININLNVYDISGVGIPERQYYCIDEKGNITLKLKSLSGSIFHEFVHCLHYAEDPIGCGADADENSLPKGNPWTSNEELRTISGYIDPGIYDPICDNCFDFYNYCIAKDRIRSTAIFKPCIGEKGSIKVHHYPIKIPRYTPRVGHIGYKE